MPTVELKQNKGFKFKLEPNFLEERKIQQEMAELSGGWDKLAELESAINGAYQKHLELNKSKLKENFIIKHKQYLELDLKDLQDKITEPERVDLFGLRSELNQNRYYQQYIALIREKSLLYNYAMLKVLCVEMPEGFSFNDQNEEKLLQIWHEVEVEKKSLIKQPAN
jgi:hypothetical protein